MLTARYLWNFLSGMSSKHKIQAAAKIINDRPNEKRRSRLG